MKFFINALVLWPENDANEIKLHHFSVDKVNVITGWSGTGKSAIISIIDYILGAKSCAIPLGPIRNEVAWYGLIITTDLGVIRVARRKADFRQISPDYWLQQGGEIGSPLPRRVGRNASLDDFKTMMDTLSGLSSLRLNPDPDAVGFYERASFRDLAAFNFIPQHIVANPYTMFFKADTHAHKEKLRNVLPLALGIMTNDDLLNMHRHEILRAKLREIDSQLKRRRGAMNFWRSNATSAFFRAQELGLLPAGAAPETLEPIIAALSLVVERAGQLASAGTDARTARAVSRIDRIKEEERQLDREIAEGKRRLKRLRGLRSSFSAYDGVLAGQLDRVASFGWMAEAVYSGDTHGCVLCGSKSATAKQVLNELQEPIADLQDIVVGTREARPMVDRDLIEIEGELHEKERRLSNLRQIRREIDATKPAIEGGQSLEDVFRFIGNVEQALSNIRAIDDDGELVRQRISVDAELREIKSLIDTNAKDRAISDILDSLGDEIRLIASFLRLSDIDANPNLDLSELNIRFDGPDKKRDEWLWEIGSGENWMGYHLCLFLALHRIFLGRGAENPVPTFLVIDQPSQVYFPSDTFDETGKDKADAIRSGKRSRQDDLQSTRRIFAALAWAAQRLECKLQIIVLEHADKSAWGDVENVHSVANWRGEGADYLLPNSWL
ncbi:hypothetical protein B2G69_17050 [Methylorubrum zatmanii]|nr:DUF3732 domain-containing protein [Methylorubrum zatmanii]ARO55664.1 hypothetical protein B2G69_17050 [Methylorubrum zatmanii]